MSTSRQAFSLVLCVCAVALACEKSIAPQPVLASIQGDIAWGSFDAELELPVPADLSAASSASGGKASGHADLHGTPVQNVQDELFSFTATSTGEDVLAKGQVEVHLLRFTGQEVMVHADVTCISIAGNQAWVGSRVTRFVQDQEEIPSFVNRSMIFRVQDFGEGGGITDLASLVFFPTPSAGADVTHCNTQPAFPILRESTSGNIQVKPN